MYQKIKRLLDFIIAIILLIVFAIPMLLVALAIKFDDGGSILYKQKRMGKSLKPFYIYKFRTMKSNREELKSELTHDKMVTRVGRVLRATSIDELPQLINILKGDMSFIGPRPWMIEYYRLFSDEQKKRCDVIPGLSGLAQVKGRNGIDIFQKINYDIEYVNSASLWLDTKLFILSIITVVKKSNSEISELGIKDELKKLKEIQNKAEVIHR